MPYIKEDRRAGLDSSINSLVFSIKTNINPHKPAKLTNEEFLNISGDINYCVSRLVSQLMGEVSYGKIAIITGVLENIKQEYYRRVAESYEDKKLRENGDIHEYKHFV